MGGGCREGYALWKPPHNWRALFRRRTWRYSRRLVFEDNLMPLVCAMVGHRPYNTSTIYEKPEHACQRCHSWLRHLDPVDWLPQAVAHVAPSDLNKLTRPRYSCTQCQGEVLHLPLTFSISGIPARTFFFCSTECRERWMRRTGSEG